MPAVQRFDWSLSELGKRISAGLSHPVVVASPKSSWFRSSVWCPASLAGIVGDRRTQFRVWPIESRSLWETECPTIEASFAEFHEWLQRESGEKGGLPRSNPFFRFPYKDVCLYAGYKEVKDLFGEGCPVHDVIDWGCAGLPGRGGSHTVFWMGTAGAYTPCHYDTYGYNIVAQLHGRKKWTLFAPNDSGRLYPTRVPYEESSVFSSVDHKNPDTAKHPDFHQATAYEVTLETGDVLYVPKNWWHLVESLDTSISVNTWVELESDKMDRIGEAVARTLVTAIKSFSTAPREDWLNPNEVLESPSRNLDLLRLAMADCPASCHQSQTLSRGKDEGQATGSSAACTSEQQQGQQQTPALDIGEPTAKRKALNIVTCSDASPPAEDIDSAGTGGLLEDQASTLEDTLLNAILSPDILKQIVSKLVSSSGAN